MEYAVKNLRLAPLALAAAVALMPAPALADGNVRCNGGPASGWKPINEVKKRAWMEGWTVADAHAEGDCYEVYARNEAGQVLEAFFHPVTLQKLVVYRRGKEIFRAPGFVVEPR
jgi:hypothetical protein